MTSRANPGFSSIVDTIVVTKNQLKVQWAGIRRKGAMVFSREFHSAKEMVAE
jgi:hypothetical protein